MSVAKLTTVIWTATRKRTALFNQVRVVTSAARRLWMATFCGGRGRRSRWHALLIANS